MRRILLAALAAALVTAAPSWGTVTATYTPASYTATSGQATFQVPFKFTSATDLLVTQNGVQLTLGSNYTAAGAGASAGGSITLVTPAALNDAIVISRSLTLTQPTSFRNAGALQPSSIENAIDRVAMQVQQVQAALTQPATINGTALVTATGSTSQRTLAARAADWVNVLDYGAKGDGITDDAQAFRSALAAATGTVMVPDPPGGAYVIKSTVPVPANHMLVGHDKRTTKLLLGASTQMLTLADGAGLQDIYLEGNGGVYAGGGVLMSTTDGRQRVTHARIINFNGNPIEFAPLAGSQSTWMDVEAWQTNGTTGSNNYAVVINGFATATSTAGGTTTSILSTMSDTVHSTGYYNGMSVYVTSGALINQFSTISASTYSGGGSWTLTVSALPGVLSNGDTFRIWTPSAVPRKFYGFETAGFCSFNLGPGSDTFIGDSFIADLKFTPSTYSTHISRCRIANQSALTIDGHNNTLVGNDIYPLITLASGADNVSIGPNSYNQIPMVDNSGNGRNSIFETQPNYYTPTATSTGTGMTLGNATITGFYYRRGARVAVSYDITFGSTTSFGTGGAFSLSLPVPTTAAPGSANTTQVGTGYAQAGGLYYSIVAVVPVGSSFMNLAYGAAGGGVNNATPFAWAAGNVLRVSVEYSP
jgi:hypothetical protein